MIFTLETKIDGSYVRGAIKPYAQTQYGSGKRLPDEYKRLPDEYKAGINIVGLDELFTADDIRSLSYELQNVADKIDEMNGVKKP